MSWLDREGGGGEGAEGKEEGRIVTAIVCQLCFRMQCERCISAPSTKNGQNKGCKLIPTRGGERRGVQRRGEGVGCTDRLSPG